MSALLGRGFIRCDCTAGYVTNECGCKSRQLFSNTRCHGSNSSIKVKKKKSKKIVLIN